MDLEAFKLRFNPIFWNSIWYFSILELPIDFFLPYQQTFDLTKEALLNLANINLCIEKHMYKERNFSQTSKKSFMTFNEEQPKISLESESAAETIKIKLATISNTDNFEFDMADYASNIEKVKSKAFTQKDIQKVNEENIEVIREEQYNSSPNSMPTKIDEEKKEDALSRNHSTEGAEDNLKKTDSEMIEPKSFFKGGETTMMIGADEFGYSNIQLTVYNDDKDLIDELHKLDL